MLLGLALAPLTDQQQGGAVDAEEEQQKLEELQQTPLTPDVKDKLLLPLPPFFP